MVLCFLLLFSGYFFQVQAKEYIFVPTVKGLDVVDCETGAVIKGARYSDYIMGASYSPDGSRYYLNAIHSIFVIDTKTFQLVDTHRFSTDLSRVTVGAFAVSNNGKQLFMTCQIVKKKQNIPRLNVLPPQFIIYDLDKKAIVKSFEIPYGANGVFPIRNDPDHVIFFALDVYKMNVKTGKLEMIMTGIHPQEGQNPRGIMAGFNNTRPKDHGIFAAPFYDYADTWLYYLMLDTRDGSIRTFKSKEMSMPFAAALSPDKKYIYAGHDELVKVDIATGETVKAVHAARGTFSSICFSSDGKKLYIGAFGADVSIYDADTLEFETVIPVGGDAFMFTQFIQ